MKGTITVVMAMVAAALTAGTVHAAVSAGQVTECDAAKAAAGCREAIAPDAAAPMTPKAAAVITRTTDTMGRFAAREVAGFFMPRTVVSIFTPQGDFVARGTIQSVFGGELYVDVPSEAQDAIRVGSVVFSNFADGEAEAYLRSHGETVTAVAQDARKDAAQIRREIAGGERRDEADRRAWQEEMTRLKMQYSYQYGDYYYGPYFSGYYYW